MGNSQHMTWRGSCSHDRDRTDDGDATLDTDIVAGRYMVTSALTADGDALHRAHRAARALVNSTVHNARSVQGHEGNDSIAFLAEGQRPTLAALALSTRIITPLEAATKENIQA